MTHNKKLVSVFGSAAPAAGSSPYEEARLVGRLLAAAGYAVATGGYGGTMSGVSQGASEAGGHVVGIASTRIEQYRGTSVNPWVKEVIRYESLSDRLLHLVMHNAGMIVLPGGIGTLSEMSLAWSLLQVGEIEIRPMALLGDTWRETVLQFSTPEYVPASNLGLLRFVESPEEAVAHVTVPLSE